MLSLLKRILPHSLFGRFLLIILLPNIIVQLVAVYVFYERHWSGVSRHMAKALSGEITMVVRGIEENQLESRENFINLASNSLYLGVKFFPGAKIHTHDPGKENIFLSLQEELGKRLGSRQYNISLAEKDPRIAVEVQIDTGVIVITALRSRISTPTTYIFILWILSTAIIFVIIAILFMRSQVRSITKLANVAEKFGRGQDIPGFKPSGATEVRQAAQAFIEMKKRINRHVEQRTEMLAGVSHDLKTPLTRMKLQLAMMEQSAEIEELQRDIIEMEKMVQEYLDFAIGR